MTNPDATFALNTPADTHTPFQATAQVVGDAHRVVHGGGQGITDRNLALASHSPGQDATPTDILSTARSPMGSPLTGRDITPKSVVNVGGMETTVAAAVKMGLLRQNAMGFYEEPGKPSGTTTPASPLEGAQKALEDALKTEREQAAKLSTPEATPVPDLAPELHAYATEFNDIKDVTTHESVVQSLINTGEVSRHDLVQVASQLGIEPDEAQRRITAIHQAYVEQAAPLAGPGAETAFEWARNNAPDILHSAIQEHVRNGNGSGYAKVMQEYLATIPDHSPHLILGANNKDAWGVRKESNGKFTVHTASMGRVEWSIAVREGLIRPHLNG